MDAPTDDLSQTGDEHAALDEEEPDAPKTTTTTNASHTDANVVTPSVERLVESIDGFDDYGNLLPTADTMARQSSLKRKAPEPPPPEPWANASEVLPKQPYSFVGWAALQVDQREVALPLPQGLGAVDAPVVERALAQLGLVPRDCEKPLLLARAPQTRLYQDGYQAAHTLTILERDEVSALLRAEVHELTNTAYDKQSPDDMLPPRAMAVTVLCVGASNAKMTPNQMLLLDAAAHLAAEPGSDGEHSNVCAASQLRMTFLHGEMALTYARARKIGGHTRCECLHKPCNELCITWTEPMAIGDSEHCIRSEFVAVPHCDTTEAYVAALLEAVLSLWRDFNIVPGPLRLMGSYAHGAAPTDAYARHCLACATAFWSKLETHYPAELSEFATNDPKYCGALAHSNLWAKVVPRNTPIDGPNTSHGILLHQEGWRDEMREYLMRAKAEEMERNVKGAYGLRAPMDSTEIAICPHLMVVNADTLHLGPELCCYGLRGVAGESFGSRLPRLVWRLLPVTPTVTEATYILPCHFEETLNAQEVTELALRRSNSRAARAYSSKIGQSALDVAKPDTSPKAPRVRTDEEETLAMLLGMPLTCRAFCIGDVANALQQATPRAARIPTGLGAFLVAAAAALTPEASINDAFTWASQSTTRVNALANANQTLTERVEELELRLKTPAAPATAPESPPSPQSPPPTVAAAPAAAPAPTPPPPPLEPMRFNNVQRGALLRRWGRVGDMSGAMFRALNNPIVGVSLKTILATVADAVKDVNADVQQRAYEWAKTTCCKKKFGDRERIVRLCHHALRAANTEPRRVFLLWTDASADATTVYEIDLSQAPETELAVCVKTKAHVKLDAKDVKNVVVLAWIGSQRALAALLPA